MIIVLVLLILICFFAMCIEFDSDDLTAFKNWICQVSQAEQMYKLTKRSEQKMNKAKHSIEINYVTRQIQEAAEAQRFTIKFYDLYSNTIEYLKREGFEVTEQDSTGQLQNHNICIVSWSAPGKKHKKKRRKRQVHVSNN